MTVQILNLATFTLETYAFRSYSKEDVQMQEISKWYLSNFYKSRDFLHFGMGAILIIMVAYLSLWNFVASLSLQLAKDAQLVANW